MKVLVLGSLGFIGSNLIDYLKGYNCMIYGCDLTDTSVKDYTYQKVSILSADFEIFFQKECFDICINASGSGSVTYSINHPISDFESNTFTVAKVLDTIRKHTLTCKYLHISSAAVYGDPISLPISESSELNPLSPYGYHKLMSEQICQEYYAIFNVPICIVRPFSVYGNGLKKQLLWDICEKFRKSKEVLLFGTGNESRDFIHIEDLCRLILKIIAECDFTGGVYNAASGVETSIADVVYICKANLHVSKNITFTGNAKEGDPKNWRADISKIKALGFNTTITIAKGIPEYVRWYHTQWNN